VPIRDLAGDSVFPVCRRRWTDRDLSGVLVQLDCDNHCSLVDLRLGNKRRRQRSCKLHRAWALAFHDRAVSRWGQAVLVIQDSDISPNCAFSVEPAFRTFPKVGGAGSVNVDAETRCAWEAVANAGWITITSATAGIGAGTVTYTVGANPGSGGRKGTLTIAGHTVAVKQKGG
jgi:hypothetical protein